MRRLSVVIANYNYEAYVAVAIESALALRWDDIEVVVVDDGSTDGSRRVIEGYGNRVKSLFTENAGQRVAASRGFALTTGDVVIFLDSDDVLPPGLPDLVAEVWTPRVSKVQFRMQRIDAAGVPFGLPFPQFATTPAPAQIRRWAAKTTAYPTPPGSGNAYARWFLEQILPLDSSLGDFFDSAPLAAAPFFGDVVSLPGVLVGYRYHGANDSNLLAQVDRFPREVARARARWRFAQRAIGTPIDERPLRRSRELLQLRVAARRVAPSVAALPGDRYARLLIDCLRSPFQIGPESIGHRLRVVVWCIAALCTPMGVVRWLLTVRYGRPLAANSSGTAS